MFQKADRDGAAALLLLAVIRLNIQQILGAKMARMIGTVWCLVLALTPIQNVNAQTISWSRILDADDRKIGHGERRAEAGPDGSSVTTERTEIAIKEHGNRRTTLVEETRRTQDATGQTISYDIVSGQGDGSLTRTSVRLLPGRAIITRIAEKDERVSEVALPPDVRLDNGVGLLRDWRPAQRPTLEFLSFNPSAQAVERVVIAARSGPDTAGNFDVLRTSYAGDRLRAVARLTVSADGRTLRSTRTMLGATISTVPSTRDEALVPSEPFSAIQNVMVKSPYRILPPALKGRIRYRFSFRDALVFAAPSTNEQNSRLVGDRLIVDVCRACGPGFSGELANPAMALKPTPWLQSDAPAIASLAKPVRQSKLSSRRKMERLAVIARQAIQILDFSGHYSALEAVRRGKGDCTEDAVVLAALGRAAGIPTLVASGLVYSREKYHGTSNVFMPHSWTLAWIDGRWQSYDISLGSFDATHIVLTIGEGDARSVAAAGQLAGLLQWEKMTEIKSRPGSSGGNKPPEPKGSGLP